MDPWEADRFHDGEYPGLVVVIPICPDTKIDLFLKLVFFVGCSYLENGIRRSERKGFPVFFEVDE